MSASDFPQTSIGLPAAFKYDLPPSISDECTSYSVNVGAETDIITGPAIAAIGAGAANQIFVASSGGGPFPFRQEQIIFNIPSGNSDSVFLDPVATTVTFRMRYTVTTQAVGGTTPQMNLIGSGASWFDHLTLYSNGKVIEDIDQYGLLQNYLLANTVSIAERWGGISTSMGADSNSATGIDLPFTGAGISYSMCFTIPLLSIIGVNSDKYFPVGIAKGLQLVLTTARNMPIATFVGATVVTTQPIFSAMVLQDFTLNMRYIDVGRQAAQQLRATLQAGKWLYKSTTYKAGVAIIPNGSVGSYQVELPIRCASLRSLLHQFGVTTSTVCINGHYDAINPAINSRQLQIGSKKYPTRPINDLVRPSESYMYLIQALGGGIAKSLGTVVFRESYSPVLPSVPAGSDAACTVPNLGIRLSPTGNDIASTSIIKYPNSAYYGYDTERVNSTLFSGVSTNQEPPVLNLNLAVAATRIVTCFAWGMADIVLQFDSVSKEVTAFV